MVDMSTGFVGGTAVTGAAAGGGGSDGVKDGAGARADAEMSFCSAAAEDPDFSLSPLSPVVGFCAFDAAVVLADTTAAVDAAGAAGAAGAAEAAGEVGVFLAGTCVNSMATWAGPTVPVPVPLELVPEAVDGPPRVMPGGDHATRACVAAASRHAVRTRARSAVPPPRPT